MGFWDQVTSWAKNVGNTVAHTFTSVKDKIVGVGSNIAHSATGFLGGVANKVVHIGNSVVEQAKLAGHKVVGVGSSIFEGAKSVGGRLLNGAESIGHWAGSQIGKGVDAAKGLIGDIGGAAKNASNSIPQLAMVAGGVILVGGLGYMAMNSGNNKRSYQALHISHLNDHHVSKRLRF